MVQQHSVEVLDHDEGIRAEDLFRRASLSWALSTKRLVESATALGPNTKVALASLVDIEYARDMLDTLFVLPPTAKPPMEGKHLITAKEVKTSVAELASRVFDVPMYLLTPPEDAELDTTEDEFDAAMASGTPVDWADDPNVSYEEVSTHLAALVPATVITDFYEEDEPVEDLVAASDLGEKGVTASSKKTHRGVDLSAPVISKNGKMLWATFDCPVCPSPAEKRCQKPNGEFIEKPHTPRKNLADQA